MSSSSLRIVTWNCRSGGVNARLAELAGYSADIVFLQECAPARALPFDGRVLARRINGAKGIALASPSGRHELGPGQRVPRVPWRRARTRGAPDLLPPRQAARSLAHRFLFRTGVMGVADQDRPRRRAGRNDHERPPACAGGAVGRLGAPVSLSG